ncbi:2'-5' RNA ligase family protein [Gordonia sp. ABSL1-1]|uniref:2'-5' RNA ligase family protein n=1 Tax=Gordonia sp. ABSL1-1 TaxID=3053923 RepID=UPI002572EB23|nr:2'-5' RNA ligase family protein [Gordonia sp. ABSL1-1]MDL9938181.1 2'-5' RNA ligase family protein [Gordonia sp. ABSL1-1]
MADSLELLLDTATESLLSGQWSALDEAGLPSARQVRSSTNRPHVTLLAAAHIRPGADATLSPVAQRLPLRAILGAPLVFGAGTHHTLARLVVPSTELLSIHATVWRLSSPFVGTDDSGAPTLPFGHTAPGAWTPHITIARRMTATQVGAALEVLAHAPTGDHEFTFTALRRWDGRARTDHILAGWAC